MKTSMRRNLAIVFLSGTTALAGPVFAQQADTTTPLVQQGQSQGSADTGGSAGANAQAETSGAVEQNSAEINGTAGGETETQASQKPLENKTEQDAAQSSDGTAKTDRQTTAEGEKAKQGGTTMDNAQSTTGQSTTEGETKTQSASGTSNSEETQDAAQSGTSNETTASIDISAEQRTEIHNVIVESKAKPVDIDIDVNVGVVVPRTVELLPLPPRIVEIVPAYRTYKYILLADGRILIVEPSSLKIVYVITG